MMMFVLVMLLTIGIVRADQIVWYAPEGCSDGSAWNQPKCWTPRRVPGVSDDVLIVGPTTISIQFNTTFTCRSLQLVNSANLNLQGTLNASEGLLAPVGSTVVMGPGNPTINMAGNASINGSFTLSPGGSLLGGGSWFFGSEFNADQNSAHTFVGSFWFGPSSSVAISGVLFMYNAKLVFDGTLTNSYSLTIFGNVASDLDASLAVWTFNATASGSQLTFDENAKASVGKFILVAGDLRVFESVTLLQPLQIPQGSTLYLLGQGIISAPNLSGNGAVVAANNATVFQEVSVGMLTLQSSSSVLTKPTNVPYLRLLGGNYFEDAVVAVNVSVEGGVVNGPGSLTCTGQANFQAAGVSIGLPFTINGNASVNGPTTVVVAGSINFGSSATFSIASEFNLTQVPAGKQVGNLGTIVVANKTQFLSVVLQGSGLLDIQSGWTLKAVQSNLSAGQVNLAPSAVLKGNFVATSFPSVAATVSTDVVTVQINGATARKCPSACSDVTSTIYDNIDITCETSL